MVNLAYGCCVGSWDKFHRWVRPRIGDRRCITQDEQTSIAVAYNTILNTVVDDSLDALILLHDDLEIIDRNAEKKFLAAVAEPDVALVGVAGGNPSPSSLAWWSGPTIGHQITDSGPLDFSERTGDVLFIEGSIMVFSPWAIANLRFDTRYGGFLGYDDICMTAKLVYGKRVIVADVDTHHHSTLGFKSEDIRQSWFHADQLFHKKWKGECI